MNIPGISKVCAWRYKVIMLLLSSAALSIPDVISAQESAADWFRTGLQASSPDDKIQAFRRVVELDPDYTEAYFYLGVAYKKKQMYDEAEKALNKAYFRNSYDLKKNIKTQILYELGTVYEIMGKLDQAEEALRGAKGLTLATDKMRGQICLRLGQVYAGQNKIDEALAEFSEGRRILPQEDARFSQAIDGLENRENLNDRYMRAIALLQTEHYEKALEQFNMILKLQPDFKDAKSKAAQAQQLLDERAKRQEIAALYNEAMTKAENDELDDAIAFMQQVVAKDASFKDAGLKLRDLQNRNRRQPVTEDPPETYNQQKLQQARLQADNQKHLAEVESLYRRGVQSLNNKDFAGASAIFQTLKSRRPGYKDVDALLLEIEATLSSQIVPKADSLFETGTVALQNSKWLDAVLAFEKVKLLDPAYPEIDNKLADARFHFEKGSTANSNHRKENDGMTVAQIMASLLALPVALALVLISPNARARFYLMRGDYTKAADIYERLLMKDPGRLKLYSILANIYLLENRSDQNAIKIFETIIKMNLYTSKKQQINTIVANYYLTEGRHDATAIAVMERELDSRLQNLNGE